MEETEQTDRIKIPTAVILLAALIIGLGSGYGIGRLIKNGDSHHTQSHSTPAY
jgi:uncharacterized membrane-anchored protein YitT (DUF2179 family)